MNDDRTYTRAEHRIGKEPMTEVFRLEDGEVVPQRRPDAMAALEAPRKAAYAEGGETSPRWRFLATAYVALGRGRLPLSERLALRQQLGS